MMRPPTRSSGPLTLLGWLLLGALLLFCSIPKASTIVFTWPWVFYSQVLLLTPALLLAVAIWQGRANPRAPTWISMALAAAIGVSVLHSREPHFSFEAAFPLWSGLSWTLWVATTLPERCGDELRFRRFARLVGAAMLIPLTLSAVLYARELSDAMHAAGTWHIELTYHRNWFPLGHWNYTGGLALLTAPWLLVLAYRERGRWRALWLVGTALDAAIFVSASSRGAVLGAALGSLFAGALWLLRQRPSRRQLLTALAIGLLLAAGLLASNPRLLELARHPTSIFQPDDGDVQRLGMLQAGWLLGQQRPWIGHGPGMVPFVYPEVRSQVIGGVETSYQLHNGPLHLWVITGAAGIGATFLLLGLGLRTLRRWWSTPDSEARTFALASGTTIVAYGGLFLTDFQFDVIAVVALLGLHCGLVFAAPPNTNEAAARPRLRRFAPLAPLLAGLAALLVLVPHWRARERFWSALATTPADNPVLLAQHMLAAAEIAPWSSHYYASAGFQLARANTNRNDPKLRELARNVLAQSLAIDPAQEPVHAALGWLWLPDDPMPARRHFETARHLLPDRPSNNLGLALACLGQDDADGAVQALALELLIDPAFIASPYWQQPPLATYRDPAYARWQELIKRALEDPKLPGWRRPALHQARAVVRWWREGAAPAHEDLDGAAVEQRAVFAALTNTNPGTTTLPPPWAALQEALARPGEAESLLTPAFGAGTPTLANALDRIAQRPANLAALLRAPSSPRTQLTHNALERAHYSLMHRNLDGPGYADMAPRLADPFSESTLATLLPSRGYIPGFVLGELATRP